MTLFLLCNTTFSQEKKTSFGLTGGPQYNTTSFYNEKETTGVSPWPNHIENYRSALSYQYGIAFNFPFSQKFSMNTGLGMTYFRYKYDYEYNTVEESDPTVKDNTTTSLVYLKIPLTFEYQVFKKDNFSISPTLGASLWIDAYYKTKNIYQNGHKESFSDSHSYSDDSFIPNFYGSIKCQFMFSEKIDLIFEPFVEKGFNAVPANLDDNTHTMFGINMGVFI